MVAITYDSPELQQAFIDDQGITFPLLSDIDAMTMKTLEILNTEYSPGDDSYGIPWPGIFIVSPAGKIVGKVFLEGYATRVEAAWVLEQAINTLNATTAQP